MVQNIPGFKPRQALDALLAEPTKPTRSPSAISSVLIEKLYKSLCSINSISYCTGR